MRVRGGCGRCGEEDVEVEKRAKRKFSLARNIMEIQIDFSMAEGVGI